MSFDALRQRGLWASDDAPPHNKTNGNGDATKHAAADIWEPIVPPPSDAPPPTPAQLKCDTLHEYRGPGGHILFYVRRYEARDGGRKSFWPLTYGILNGKRGWHGKAPASPKPLYRLDALAKSPNGTVLLCEGEKSADAAQRLFPDYVATSWMGGSHADLGADLEPLTGRQVIVWPDADEAGLAVAQRLAKRLPRSRVLTTDGLPDGFDAADLLQAGEDPVAWLQERLPPPRNSSLLIVNPATLDGLPVPPRQWLVPDWVPMARATSLYGGGGEGKTLLAQMLATACALLDAKWLGLAVRQCKSVLQFCEDDTDEMWRRQEDINRLYGCSFADLSAMRWLPRLGFDNTLMTFETGRGLLTDLHAELLDVIQQHEAQLIITDTLADVFGGNENIRVQARAFVQTALGGIARQTGGAVMALAHPSLSGANSGTGSSGSTGWIGTFRSHLFLASPKTEEGEPLDPDVRVLTRGKANNARRGETIDIRWKAGGFVVTGASGGLEAAVEKRTCEDVFLILLGRMRDDGRYVSDNPRAGNYAPRAFAKCPDRQGFKAADFTLAMERLFQSKTIRLGQYKDSHYRLTDCLERNDVA